MCYFTMNYANMTHFRGWKFCFCTLLRPARINISSFWWSSLEVSSLEPWCLPKGNRQIRSSLVSIQILFVKISSSEFYKCGSDNLMGFIHFIYLGIFLIEIKTKIRYLIIHFWIRWGFNNLLILEKPCMLYWKSAIWSDLVRLSIWDKQTIFSTICWNFGAKKEWILHIQQSWIECPLFGLISWD